MLTSLQVITRGKRAFNACIHLKPKCIQKALIYFPILYFPDKETTKPDFMMTET